MKHFFLLSLLAFCISASAQAPSGRSKIVTLFPDYKPAVIKLTDGKTSIQKYTNIFLKNSSLIYKKSKDDKVMEASMQVIKSVTIDNREFIKVKNQLAEVVATEGNASLVRVRTIDIETMKGEYLNNSTITSTSMLDDLSAGRGVGESLSTIRMDGAEEEEPYPLMDQYYYVYGDKTTLAHERSVKVVIKKDQRKEYQNTIAFGFNWTNLEDLTKLLKFFQ